MRGTIRQIISWVAVGSFITNAQSALAQYPMDNLETAVVKAEDVASKSLSELHKIYAETYWGWEQRPPGLHKDVPRIVDYGNLAIPVSVGYLLRGRLDQRKTAAHVLERLAPSTEYEYVDNIISAYTNERDSDAETRIGYAVHAVLMNKGFKEKLAKDCSNWLDSADDLMREKSVKVFLTFLDPSMLELYEDKLISAYKEEKKEQIKDQLGFALMNQMRSRKELALSLANSEDSGLRAWSMRSLGSFHYQDTKVRRLLQETINDRKANENERYNAVMWGGSNNERWGRINGLIEDPNEPSSFRIKLLSRGIEVYLSDTSATEEGYLPISEYETVLACLLDRSVNDRDKSVRIAAMNSLKRKEDNSDSSFLYSIESRLSILYLKRARTDIEKNKLELAKEDLYRAVILTKDLPRVRENILDLGLYWWGGGYPTNNAYPTEYVLLLVELQKKEQDPVNRKLLTGAVHYVSQREKK